MSGSWALRFCRIVDLLSADDPLVCLFDNLREQFSFRQSGRGYGRPARCCNVCSLAALRAGRGAGGVIADAQQQFFHFTQHLLASSRLLFATAVRRLDAQLALPDELSAS